VDDERFLEVVADRASEIPGVVAVALGGSRAQGRHRSDSDWIWPSITAAASRFRTCATPVGRASYTRRVIGGAA